MGVNLFVNPNSAIDQFIQTTLQLEARPRLALEDRKADLNRRGAVLTDLESKLSKLHSLAKSLVDPLDDPFGAKTTTSSNTDKFTATATSSALLTNHDISIQRLAVADTRVSKQYTSTATDLRTFFDTNGSQTFQIQVAHPTSTDSTNRVNISVTVNPTGTDNDSILDEIALAINNAMDAAVTAGTIEADEKASASVVHEQSGTSRIIFKSGQTGFTYRMGFTDSANSLLSTLEVSNSVQTSGTSGGFVTAIGTSATDSSLNAQLQVDGLTFYRDSNTISDIIDGVTLTLKDLTTTTESLQVTADKESVKQKFEELLSAYNDVLAFLRDKTSVDSETKVRGVLAGDSTYRGLLSTLRGILTGQVSSVTSGNPETLFELGVTAASDGTLTLTDVEKLNSALTSGANKVSDLFDSANGIAVQLKTTLEEYVKVGGLLDDAQKSVDDRVENVDKRIEQFDERLARREQQLRDQFARMQQLAQLLGGQQISFTSLTGRLGF
ncbi:MAG: flagellar hook protein FliD [Calditrichaeota bacterium]|nr:MAG: flagellar hook protein FliD [Calditrichota bacterium]